MNSLLKGILVYLFVLVIFRFMGKKNLAETTTFDLVLLLNLYLLSFPTAK